MTTLPLQIGAHMSTEGGLHNAFQRGKDAGCDSLQIFVKNQRQWNAKPLTDENIHLFKEESEKTSLFPVIAHASYLLNLASPKPENRKKSINALLDEYQRCEALGIDYVVFHPGSAMDSSEKQAIKNIASGLDKVHKQSTGFSCMILLETTAGQGTSIGHTFEQLSEIISKTKHPERLGVCLDTCHLFVAGYDFRREDGYADMTDSIHKNIGFKNIRCIHTNDSKGEMGSRLDRHEHIGKGKIGVPGFRHFINDIRIRHAPFILETPKGKDGRGADMDKVNINKLRRMLDQ